MKGIFGPIFDELKAKQLLGVVAGSEVAMVGIEL